MYGRSALQSVGRDVVVFTALWATTLVGTGSAQIPDGPYFGQDPPGFTPEIFAPGVVCFPDRREARLGFSADGLQFAVDVSLTIEYTRQEAGHWLPWDNTVFAGGVTEPFFSPDGTRFFSQKNGEIYMSTFEAGAWTAPARLPAPVNLFTSGAYLPTAAADGTLYFTSNRDGSGGGGPDPTSKAFAVYRAPLVDGAYPVVEKLGPEVNGPDGAWDPFIAPDKSYLIFGIDRGDGTGTNLFVSFAKPDGSWTTPRDLGPPINTDAIEYGPYISYDGKYLFFGRPAGWVSPDQPSDIYWVDAALVFDPPVVATGEVARTNRYLRFSTPGGSGPQVIRVRTVSLDGFPNPSQDVLYVGPPVAAPEEDDSQPNLTFTAAPLQCSMYEHDWTAEGVISVYGAEIMPGSTYEIQRAFASCLNDSGGKSCWSSPLTITTAKYGDVAPLFDDPANPQQPDFNDIAALVDKFLGVPGAPIKAVAQLQPNVAFPTRVVDFRDIAAGVQAFLGQPYAATSFGPCVCPSSVTCHATPCGNDLACGSGLCVDEFCTDECGRCTP